MPTVAVAPWTNEQVEALSNRQTRSETHPYTCGKCGNILVPFNDGWRCECGYHQNWCLKEDIDEVISHNAQKQCQWKPNDDWDYSGYATSCGEEFVFEHGSPGEHHYKYCPTCGREIVLVGPSKVECDEDDAEE